MWMSLAWTTPALLAGRKRCTRRDWLEKHAQKFKAGDIVDAYDKNPRNGGKEVCKIMLTCNPYRQSTDIMPRSDYEAEGFGYLEEQGLRIGDLTPREFWDRWKAAKIVLWVIRFVKVE